MSSIFDKKNSPMYKAEREEAANFALAVIVALTVAIPLILLKLQGGNEWLTLGIGLCLAVAFTCSSGLAAIFGEFKGTNRWVVYFATTGACLCFFFLLPKVESVERSMMIASVLIGMAANALLFFAELIGW